MKLLKTETKVLKKIMDKTFDKTFNISDEIDNNCNKRYNYKPWTSNKTNTKETLLNFFRIIEDKLLDMLSLPNIVKKRNNPNHKYYTYDKLNRNCIKKIHATPLLILLNLKS